MSLPGPGLEGIALEAFDYARVGEHVAVLRVLARLAGDLGAPAGAQLLVHGQPAMPLSFDAQACRSERRLLAGGENQLLWRALFQVPFAVVERCTSVFELSAAGYALIMPSPHSRAEEFAALQLTPAGQSSRIAALQLRQAVALATTVAVTATSTPAVALAAGGTAAGAQPISHRQTTELRLAGHAGFAATRLRERSDASAKAARRAARARRKAKRTQAATARRAHRAALTRPPAAVAGQNVPVATQPNPARRASAHCRPAIAPISQIVHEGTITPTAAPTAAAPTGASRCTLDHPRHLKPRPTGREGERSSTGQVPSAPVTGGAPIGTGTTPSAPTTVAPKLPVATMGPPAVARVRVERVSHRQLPVTIRRTASGGAATRPLGGLTSTPPVKLAGTTTGPSPGAPTLSPTPAGFSGPKSWTGTVTNDPALTSALGNLSNALANGNTPPAFLIPIYMEAGRRYHVPWEVLAGINSVESDFGRDLSTSTAGAIGWMQFEPSTWKQYGVAADGHSVPNPYDPRDAIFSAARYLAAAGAAQDVSRAIYAYNHAGWYVDMVLARARSIAAGVRPQRQTVSKKGVISVFFATSERHHRTVRFKGGVLSHFDRLIAAANMVSAANFPYLYGGGHEQPARFGPFDCSGSVSYVMQQAGYKVPTTVSGDIPIWKFPKGPGRVTIFYNPTHTFMRVGNRYFGTSGFARGAGGGAGWFDTQQMPESYLANFAEVHVPRLGINAFAPAKHRHPHTHPHA